MLRRMKNSEIAKNLWLISIYENMQNSDFKARAYEKASRIIESLPEELAHIYDRGGMEEILKIPGIGKGIGKKIEDFLTVGKTKHLERLKKNIPVEVEEILKLEGIGPKTIKVLWEKLKVKSISDLKKAAQNHQIQKISGFGPKKEKEILQSIEFYQKHKDRFLLGEMLPLLENINLQLQKIPIVKRAVICGSVRRMKETIGDADFLVQTNKPKEVMDFFISMPEVTHIYSRGKSKLFVRLENGLDADLQVTSDESFGAALVYFTGNKFHNVQLRNIAKKKGWKLNEYGIWKNDKLLYGKSEKEIYNNLELDWIPPELRENKGEIELAQNHNLPRIIGYNSLKGDLQMHSNWSDGELSIQQVATAAKKHKLKYIAITDHSKRLTVAGGITEKQLEQQGKEIDEINKKLDDMTILKGIEVDILKDGTLDFSNKVLRRLDVVGASIHSHFTLSKKEQTQRIIKVIENPHVDVLFHPTARLIQKREPCQIDLEKIFETAKNCNTLLEIDASAKRLDLNDDNIRLAKSVGCKFVIDSDAHSAQEFDYLRLGIGQARRAGITKKDIANTKNLEDFKKILKK